MASRSSHTSNSPPTTSAGLQKWVKTLFTTLGWMLLADRSQRRSSIKSYMDDLKYVKGLLYQKAQGTVDPDRKADLLILHSNVEYLEMRCRAIFKSSGTLPSLRSGKTSTRASTAVEAPVSRGFDRLSDGRMENVVKKHSDMPKSMKRLLDMIPDDPRMFKTSHLA